MSKAEYCVFIGRFQPFHNAHLKICNRALEEEAEKLIVVVGSYRTARSLRNPWTFEERRQMILSSLPREHADRTIVVPARDYLYSDLNWLTGIQNAISQVVGDSKDVKIIGHFKDDSSYYLKLFPQWQLVSEPNYFGLDATDIREELFSSGGKEATWWNKVPEGANLVVGSYTETENYKIMVKEHDFITKYRAKWADAPFPPTFVTTDAVVVQAGHVLLVKRKLNPGKGMFALPGGFIKQGEKIIDSCLRELKEETNILFPKEELRKSFRKLHIFDHPARDQRGRTITHGYFFHLNHLGPLPQVKGGDDAAEALWVPISDLTLYEENFFSDHLHIINYFLHQMGGTADAT